MNPSARFWRVCGTLIFMLFSFTAMVLWIYSTRTPQKPEYVALGIDDPRPVCFCLFGGADLIRDPYFGRVAEKLRRQGWIVISLDLVPGDGEDLNVWNQRMKSGQDVIGDFCRRASKTLDDIESKNRIDTSRICVYGISRGGFMAVQWAARDHRIARVAGMSPIVELNRLIEFPGRKERLQDVGGQLRCPVRIWVSRHDPRVDEQAAYRFATECKSVDVYQMDNEGHHTTDEAFRQAADWLGN